MDIDGNVYRTVKIGNQTWMAENLRVNRLNDGQPIPYAPEKRQWGSLFAPGYCWPGNDTSKAGDYGALYNWYALESGKIAPKGWHVPTEAEWMILADYLGGISIAGGKLKEMGFAEHIAGVRTYDGEFGYLGEMEKYWTATEGGWHPGDCWYYCITKFDTELSKSSHMKGDGHSVRLVKDTIGPIPNS